MSLHPLAGHHEARRRLASSFRTGRLPQVILVTGPAGIGKQRFGLWLAQLLLCEDPAEEPCGRCRACRLVLTLSHPDLHWFIPIPRPRAATSDPDKQVEEAADLLAEAVAARREQPWYEPPDGMASHSLASAKLLLRRAAVTPALGTRKVFLLGEADRLVIQESSPEAANALLKLLEEPPADTWIVLTTTEPERVLPTIRSRAVPLRLTPLAEAERKAFPAGRAGSGAGDAKALLEAIKAGGIARFERSLKQAPWSARGGFTALLDAVGSELSDRARETSDPEATRQLALALDQVQVARVEAQGNVNPQLLLASLSARLAELL